MHVGQAVRSSNLDSLRGLVFRLLQKSMCPQPTGYRPCLRPAGHSKCANSGNSGQCTVRSAGGGLIMQRASAGAVFSPIQRPINSKNSREPRNPSDGPCVRRQPGERWGRATGTPCPTIVFVVLTSVFKLQIDHRHRRVSLSYRRSMANLNESTDTRDGCEWSDAACLIDCLESSTT